jgi:Ca2+-binding RTX toxin-like protein
MALLGEGGNDTLTTPATTAQGGPGDDRFVGFPNGGTTLEGEAGTDTFALPAFPSGLNLTLTAKDSGLTLSAPDVPSTQTGAWTSIEALDLTLSDAAETVDATGFSGSARVLAKGGSDTLLGTANADDLDGGLGNDFIDGGAGSDVHQGGPGYDVVRARDGFADSGDCGTDDDTAFVDALDTLVGCELVDAPAGPPEPPPATDTTAPVLTLAAASVTGGKLRVPVTCPAAETRCVGVLTLTATGRRKGKRRTVGLGAATVSLAGGATATLTKRVTRGQRRALRALSRRRLRVKTDVLDVAGNRTQATKGVRLKLR